MRTKTSVIARNKAISEPCKSQNGNAVKVRLPQLLALLFFLLLSGYSSAQKKDTIKATTIYDLLQQIKKQPGTSDPVVMVDDSVFKGDLHKIDSKDVMEVQVIKGNDAAQIYGQNAKNGVFMVKTKKAVYAGIPQDDIAKLPERRADVVYILDDMLITKQQADTAKCLIKKVMPGNRLRETGIYPGKPTDTVTLLITKAAARRGYQEVFAALSQPYADHLAHGNDNDVNYVFDGKFVKGSAEERIKQLFEAIGKTKSVKFIKNQSYNGAPSKPYIAILKTKL